MGQETRASALLIWYYLLRGHRIALELELILEFWSIYGAEWYWHFQVLCACGEYEQGRNFLNCIALCSSLNCEYHEDLRILAS